MFKVLLVKLFDVVDEGLLLGVVVLIFVVAVLEAIVFVVAGLVILQVVVAFFVLEVVVFFALDVVVFAVGFGFVHGQVKS